MAGEYEINEVRVEGDTALIVLVSDSDGFGVSIPYSQLLEMTDSELDAYLESKVKERVEQLTAIEKEKEANKSKEDSVKHLVGKKIKAPKKRMVKEVENK